MKDTTVQPHEATPVVLVGDVHAGQRVDNYLLREFKGVPRQLIYRLLRQGKVRCNGRRIKPEARLVAGDRLSLPRVRVAQRQHVLPQGQLPDIVYEDHELLVLAKPAGMAVHGGSGLTHGLIELARYVRGEPELELAHRLDKDTSGLIVLCKRRSGLRWFHEQLRAGTVGKHYRAAVCGRWCKTAARISWPLLKIPADQGGRRTVIAANGKPALTRTHCLLQGARGAMLEINLVTGKTHQARAHLAHAGMPILGDARYGDRAQNRSAGAAGYHGMFLHAWRLVLPERGKQAGMVLTCPVPVKFHEVRKWLAGGQ